MTRPGRSAGRGTWSGLAGATAVTLLAVSVPLLALAAHRAPVRLVAATPADGARLAALPATVDLTFSAEPLAERSHVSLRDAAGVLSRVPARFDGRTVTLPVAPAGAGGYLAGYHVEFDNGRELTGAVRFTVDGAGSGPDLAADRAATDTAGAESTGGHGHGAVDPATLALLGVDAAVLVGLLVAVVVRRRGGRGARDAPKGS